jgi:hypothetical protein
MTLIYCYATEDAVQIVDWFYYNLTRRDYHHLLHCYTFTQLQANLYTQSGVVFAYSVSLSLKHLKSLPLFFTYKIPVTVSYRELLYSLSLSLMLRPTVSLPVCLGIKHPSGACDQIFISARNTEYVWQLHSWFRGAPSLTRERVCLLYVPLALPAQSFSVLVPWDLRPYFTVSDFRLLFVASYDSQGHGGGIRPRLHTGDCSIAPMIFKITPLHWPHGKPSLHCWEFVYRAVA